MENTLSTITQKKVEKKALIVCAVINLIMAGAGLWVYIVTNIQALFLDFFFSFIGFASNIFAVIISDKSKKRTKLYPDGIYFLEPLYAILKSLLTLTLLVISVVGTALSAYDYFANGNGSPMITGPVLPYSISMVVLCFGLFFFNRFQNKKINNISTIINAESKSNFVDGIISLGLGLGVFVLQFIDLDGPLGFLNYTGDFFITVVLVLFSIKEPLKVLFSSFKELSGGTVKDKKILLAAEQSVNEHLSVVINPVRLDVFKIGMHISIRVTLPSEIDSNVVIALDDAKSKILTQLSKDYDSVELKFLLQI